MLPSLHAWKLYIIFAEHLKNFHVDFFIKLALVFHEESTAVFQLLIGMPGCAVLGLVAQGFKLVWIP